ncbi:fimbrillin family protein, partial [Bacteroides heparinolyticus]
KKISIPAMIAAIAMTAASCSRNDELNAPKDNFPADGVIRVTADVRAPQTRAGMTATDLDKFYLVVENSGGVSEYSYFAAMKKADGVWKSYDASNNSLTMLWQNKTTPVYAMAVAVPQTLNQSHLTAPLSVSVEQNQSTAENIRKSDVLMMAVKTVNPATDLTADGKMKVAFKHQFSKLNLTVKLGTEFNMTTAGTDTNPISAVAVEGTNTSMSWTINSNTLTNPSNLLPITPYAVSYTRGVGETTQAEAKYECILMPQDTQTDAFGVKITIGGKNYVWHITGSLTLAPDTQYNLTLTVGKDVITMGGFSVTPWTDGGTTSIETE